MNAILDLKLLIGKTSKDESGIQFYLERHPGLKLKFIDKIRFLLKSMVLNIHSKEYWP